jgi:hypothetical protein
MIVISLDQRGSHNHRAGIDRNSCTTFSPSFNLSQDRGVDRVAIPVHLESHLLYHLHGAFLSRNTLSLDARLDLATLNEYHPVLFLPSEDRFDEELFNLARTESALI